MKKTIKETILRTYLLDLGFVFFLGLFLFYAKLKLKSLLTVIYAYAPQINAIDPNVDAAGAQNLINNIGNAAGTAYTLLIIIPVIIFLVYVIFQGLNFYYLNKKKLYLVYFSVFSLISYILFILLIFKGFDLVLSLIFLVIAYLTFLSYFKINEKEYINLLKKSYIMIPVFLGYLGLWLISLSMFFMSLLNYSVNENYIFSLILGLLFLFGVSWYRVLIMKRFS